MESAAGEAASSDTDTEPIVVAVVVVVVVVEVFFFSPSLCSVLFRGSFHNGTVKGTSTVKIWL